MCIYQRQYTKALSNLTVGREFHYVIRRTVQCFADLTHGFNRDIFIPCHFGNDIVADACSLFKVFLFHIPVDQQFPELFIAYIHTVSLDSNRINSQNRNSRSWLFRIKYHISFKNATVYKAIDLIFCVFSYHTAEKKKANRILLRFASAKIYLSLSL